MANNLHCDLIDHYDSFTYNIKSWLEYSGFTVSVHNYCEYIFNGSCDLLLLSPGPKSPKDYPETLDLIDIATNKVPIFGICLGMQMLIYGSGGKIRKISPPVHGKSSQINIDEHKMFIGLTNKIEVARYHSLAAIDVGPFNAIARTDDNILMAIADEKLRLYGVQFHPESFLTKDKEQLGHNLYHLVKECL
jgi:anthranilate synthase component 2